MPKDLSFLLTLFAYFLFYLVISYLSTRYLRLSILKKISIILGIIFIFAQSLFISFFSSVIIMFSGIDKVGEQVNMQLLISSLLVALGSTLLEILMIIVGLKIGKKMAIFLKAKEEKTP